jgi:hypothetical protein
MRKNYYWPSIFILVLLLICSCRSKPTGYDWTVPAPVIDPPGGVYTEPITVTMSCEMEETEIRYTLDGSEPTENSFLYEEPITFPETDTLLIKARAFRFVHDPSKIVSAEYIINLYQLPKPVIEPAGYSFTHPVTVSISSDVPESIIRYTIDGSTPDIESPAYNEPFLINENKLLKARSFQYGFIPSETATEEYSFIPNVSGWGSNIYGQLVIPGTCIIVGIAAGGYHSLILRDDGKIIGFGSNSHGQINTPESDNHIAVSAGSYHSLAIRADGSLVAWGWNQYGQTDVPAGNDFSAISAGHYHNLALRIDGSIVGWGCNLYGQSDAPPGNDFVAVAAGSFHSLALRNDGSIIGWGNNWEGQIDTPSNNDFMAISAGGSHSAGLSIDGSITAWGNNNYGQTNVPSGNDYVRISAGITHNIALRADGSIVHWGDNSYGLDDVATGKSFQQISAGRRHNLALFEP